MVPGYWETIGQNCAQWAQEVSAGPFWTEVRTKLSDWSAEYRRTTGGNLVTGPLPLFVGKDAARIKSKVLGNCRRDAAYGKAALGADGPPIPQLKDLVRTRISCKFVDGVEHLAGCLEDLGKALGVSPARERLGRLEGYFAQHVTFRADVYYRFGGGTTPTGITCEVQVATDLSTRVWEAAHQVYEGARETSDEPAEWQWNPNDPRFVARQLGHMIHLADGMLVQLRDNVRGRKKGSTS